MEINVLRSILVVVFVPFILNVAAGVIEENSLSAEPSRNWQTDRGKFLDSEEVFKSMSDSAEGRKSQSGQKTDFNDAADQVLRLLLAELVDNRGVHIETALATVGALAGFSVQMALREAVVKTGHMAEKDVFVVVETKTGETYYFGDALNEMLFEPREGNFSIWSLVGGAVQELGAEQQVDIKDLAGHVADTIGGKSFGTPRLPRQHMPAKHPLELLDRFWHPIRNLLFINTRSPLEWPLVLGLVAQKLIMQGKDAIDPGLASKIVMEAAVPLAKVDPARVRRAFLGTQ